MELSKRKQIQKLMVGSLGIGLAATSITTVATVTHVKEKISNDVDKNAGTLNSDEKVINNYLSSETDFEKTKAFSYDGYNEKENIHGGITVNSDDVPALFGGSSDFRLALGFKHDNYGERGWDHMFWGNQYEMIAETGNGSKDIGNKPVNIDNKYTIQNRDFTYVDHEGYGYGDPRFHQRDGGAHIINNGRDASTLYGKDYDARVKYLKRDGNDSSIKGENNANVWDGHFASKFHTDATINSVPKENENSNFLLFLYSLLVTGEGEKITGDNTFDSSPELQFISPALEVKRGSGSTPISWESIGASTAGLLHPGVIGQALKNPKGIIAGFGAQFLAEMLLPALEKPVKNAGIASFSHAQNDFVTLTEAKSFLSDSAKQLNQKYFQDKSYDVRNFFFTDISLSLNAQFKLHYDGMNGWKPYISAINPTVSYTYHVDGFRTILNVQEHSVAAVVETRR